MAESPQSFGEDAPSGENLEYEQVFTELEIAAQFEPERQAGNEIIPAQPPDPAKVVTAAEAVLAQSHDLRAAVLLGYAKLRTEGFAGFTEATGYIRGCLEGFWDSCHPQLDAEDDNDPAMRVNALRALADRATILSALSAAPLTQSPNFGRLSLNDIAIAEGEVSPPDDMDSPPDPKRVAAAFKDTPGEWLRQSLDAARTALADVEAIDAVFDEKLPGQGPDLAPLLKLLKRATARLAAATGAAEGDAVDVAASTAASAPAAAAAPAAVAGGAPGVITSPADVERAIDRILEYYSRAEPSSPLPILLRRARRLIGADFMTIVADIAPDSTQTILALGGITETEPEEETASDSSW